MPSEISPSRAPPVVPPINVTPAFFFVGGYLTVLGACRLWETVPLALGPYVIEGYPDWLPNYLVFVSALFLTSGVFLLGAAARARFKLKVPNMLGILGGALILSFAVVHALFLLNYEHSFADGGMVWGVVHILTLTREVTTGTDAGVFGYQIGLGMGMIIWVLTGVGMLGAGLLQRREELTPAASPASGPPDVARGSTTTGSLP